jgi:hypothetical protein
LVVSADLAGSVGHVDAEQYDEFLPPLPDERRTAV